MAKAKAAKAPASKTADTARGAAAAKAAPARPVPVARLGDDLPAGGADAPKPSREPASLVLGKAEVAGGKVRMRRMAPEVLRVARGQVLHVKHTYRLQEHSDDREEYRFLLRSSLGGKAHAPSLARLGDQWGVPEDVSGYLQHEYTCSAPGRHVLEFELGAEYCVMGWGDTDVKHLDRAELKGTVEIVVA